MALLLLIADEQNRRALRRERMFRDRVSPLDIYDDVDLIKRYRMPRHLLLEVIDMIGPALEYPTERNHAIPVPVQVLCGIRYFAKGLFQVDDGDFFGISQSSFLDLPCLKIWLPRFL
jgi:hypothetical protein